MRFLIAFLMLTCPLFASEELQVPGSKKPGINVYQSYGEAKQAVNKDPNKRLFCMFTAKWCQPCQQLKADVIFNEQIWGKINEFAIVYFLDVDDESDIAQLYQKHKVWDGNLPTCFVYSKDATKILGTLTGYSSIQKFAQWWNVSIKKDKTAAKPNGPEPIINDKQKKTANMLFLATWLKDVLTEDEIKQLISMLQYKPQETSIIVEPTSMIDDNFSK